LIISASPALQERAIVLIYKQRQALAAALAAETEYANHGPISKMLTRIRQQAQIFDQQ
jgi:hypothetical protein